MDLRNMQCKKVLVLTDKHLVDLPPVKSVADSLTRSRVPFTIWPGVEVEPTDLSVQKAIEHARREAPDGVVAVGGGSTMDTAKIAAICAANKTVRSDRASSAHHAGGCRRACGTTRRSRSARA